MDETCCTVSGVASGWDMLFHAVASSYHWRELPQLSFLSQQNFCCDDMFVATNVFVATKVMTKICLLRQNLSWQNYVCRHKYFSWQNKNDTCGSFRQCYPRAWRYDTEASAPCNPPPPPPSPISFWFRPQGAMFAGKLWALTPSPPQPVQFPGWMINRRARLFSGPGPMTCLLSVLCVLVKIHSYACAKKKKKGLMVLNFAFYWSFKWRHGGEGVKRNLLQTATFINTIKLDVYGQLILQRSRRRKY